MSLSAQLAVARRDFTVEIDLDVAAETLVIVGPSGCGKTTVLRALAGLLAPDRARIRLDGRLLHATEQNVALPPEHRQVGVVFQNYALFPHLDVTRNLAYGLTATGRADRDRRVRVAMQRVRITHLDRSRPAELSGGEQQRVAVARALITEPRLLLLDEPLSALDIDTRTSVRRELAVLLRELAIPTIVVTHDLRDAEVLADRIAVMDRGRIVQIGSPTEVTAHPANAFVAQFTGTNLIPATLLAPDPDPETDTDPDPDAATDPDAASDAVLAVDPAEIRLTRQRDGDRPGWATTIVTMQPRGSIVRIGLSVPPDAVADVAADEATALGLAIGDTVTAHLPTDARALLPAPANTPTHSDGHTGDGPIRAAASRRRAGRPGPGGAGLHRVVAVALAVIAALVVVSATLPPPGQAAAAAEGQDAALTAFVAANATDPFNQVIDQFQRAHPGTTVRASYTGTQILYTQMQQGAPVDLFLSADESHAKQALGSGLIGSYYPVSRTSEALVVPRSNPAGITSLQDLATHPAKLIIGVPTVPIGIYTRQILTKANTVYGPGFSDQVLAHLVSTETDVKQVLHKVALDEADAGIVYRTDVTPQLAAQIRVIDIPAALQVIAINYIAVPVRAPHPAAAHQLLDYLLSAPGQAVFTQFGYLPLPAPTAPNSGSAPIPGR